MFTLLKSQRKRFFIIILIITIILQNFAQLKTEQFSVSELTDTVLLNTSDLIDPRHKDGVHVVDSDVYPPRLSALPETAYWNETSETLTGNLVSNTGFVTDIDEDGAPELQFIMDLNGHYQGINEAGYTKFLEYNSTLGTFSTEITLNTDTSQIYYPVDAYATNEKHFIEKRVVGASLQEYVWKEWDGFTFNSISNTYTRSDGIYDWASYDFDNDTNIDLVCNWGYYVGKWTRLELVDGSFEAVDYPFYNGGRSIFVADLDRDGNPNVAVLYASGIIDIYNYNPISNGFDFQQSISLGTPLKIIYPSDYDNNGFDNIIVVSNYGFLYSYEWDTNLGQYVQKLSNTISGATDTNWTGMPRTVDLLANGENVIITDIIRDSRSEVGYISYDNGNLVFNSIYVHPDDTVVKYTAAQIDDDPELEVFLNYDKGSENIYTKVLDLVGLNSSRYEETFSNNVFAVSTDPNYSWQRSGNSVTITNGVLEIASDGINDDYAKVNLLNGTISIQLRARVTANGGIYNYPEIEIRDIYDQTMSKITFSQSIGWRLYPHDVINDLRGPTVKNIWYDIMINFGDNSCTLYSKKPYQHEWQYIGRENVTGNIKELIFTQRNDAEIEINFIDIFSDKLSYGDHAPINISSDIEFNSTNGVVAGDGTIINPYIIEGWNIINSSGHGIAIQNTNAHFVIRNCWINAGNSLLDSGIYLNNVEGTAVIVENTCTSNSIGIYLNSSSYNNISNNICTNNDDGILIESSNNNTVNNNTCAANANHGVYLSNNSNNNTLFFNLLINNTISDGVDNGISNQWYNSLLIAGNYWGKYDGNGIYLVSGSTGSQDLYPLFFDTDSDGLADYQEEYLYLTNPLNDDSDGDGLSDGDEIITFLTNPLLSDSDSDGMDDAYEVYNNLNPLIDDSTSDFDGDGLTNLQEYQINTAANNTDTDFDLLPDGWEVDTGTNPLLDDSAGDLDGDTLTNYEEFILGTHANNTDTDADELSDNLEANTYFTDPLDEDTDDDIMLDGWEVNNGLNPLVDDSSLDADSDGLNNLDEYTAGTDPQNTDTDTDLLPDGWEVSNNLNPLVNDSALDPDSDGLTNLEEYNNLTDPNDSDSDNDGLTDGEEVNTYLTDPNDSDTDDDSLTDGWEIENGYDPLVDDSADDSDNDGLTNLEEIGLGTNSMNNDTDSDGLLDGEEVNNYLTNPLSPDTDNDGISDGWEVDNSLNPLVDDSSLDADSDGLNNLDEYTAGTDPQNTDTDTDLLPDGWEVDNSLNPLVDDASLDPDSDGLTNLEEYTAGTDPHDDDSDNDELLDGEEIAIGTNPNDSDTDNDSLSDGWEVANGFDPLLDDSIADPDSDGLSNLDEYNYNTNPNLNDTDSDGVLDGEEVFTYLTDPLSDDSDSDGLSDGEEINVFFTNPLLNDTDSDGMDDFYEISYSLNPLIDDADSDLDVDGLTNLQEFNFGTLPNNNDTDADFLSDYDEILTYSTNATNPDSDNDGLLDGIEVHEYNSNPLSVDSDSDGLTDGEEVSTYFTNPISSDTDSDGMDDLWEVETGTNPLSDDADSDFDGDDLSNIIEYQLGTLANNTDTDGDQMPDGWEVANGLNPKSDDANTDLDGDGLTNLKEYQINTLPNNPDTDGDGETDGEEVANGFDPLDSQSNLAQYQSNRTMKIVLYSSILASIVTVLIILRVMYSRSKKRKIAKALGFESLKEMNELQREGYQTKKEWETVKSLGFSNREEYLYAQTINAENRDDLYSIINKTIINIQNSFELYKNDTASFSRELESTVDVNTLQNFSKRLKEIKSNLESVSNILETFSTNKVLDHSLINLEQNLLKDQNMISESILTLEQKIEERLPQLSERNKLVDLLNQFTPDVPVALERISKITGLSRDKAETYIKEIIRFNPEVGTYLELEQVFIKQTEVDIKIDELFTQFQKWEKEGRGKLD